MRISVLVGGSWGTALAILLADNGHRVSLWQFDSHLAETMINTRENLGFLPGIHIPEDILISSSLKAILVKTEIIVFAIPSHFLRETARKVATIISKPKLIVSCTKGIETGSLKRMSEILKEELSLSFDQIVVLSGPSHAEEVSRKIPTTVVAASNNLAAARKVQQIFMSPTFRVYTNDDLIGVELGGALKNVIALAAGICDGLGFGDNTKGALMTRGLAEITRLGKAMGANPTTFAGLSGIGDLITTCISRHSRNRYVGEQLGKGKKLKEILKEMLQVAEGINTTWSAFILAQKLGIEMPITTQVYEILFKGKNPKKATFDLMMRKAKPEMW
mgnify:CR=1 FL=1